MDALGLRLSNYLVTKDSRINSKKIFHYANKKVQCSECSPEAIGCFVL